MSSLPAPSDGKRRLSVRRLVLVLLPLAALVALAAYYQETLQSYLQQEGWNPGAAEGIVRRFLEKARTPEGEQVTSLLASGVYEPVIKGGRLVALTHWQGMSRTTTPIEKFVRAGDAGIVRATRSDFLVRAGGSFRVLVQFEDAQWGVYRVKKQRGVRRIIHLATEFFSAPPKLEDH